MLRAPLRMADLVLGARRRFATNVAQEHRLPTLLLVLTVATAVFALPFGAVLGLAGFWRVAALLLGALAICIPSLHVFGRYLGRGLVVGADAGGVAGGDRGDVAVHARVRADRGLPARDDDRIARFAYLGRRWPASCWGARSWRASASCSACCAASRRCAGLGPSLSVVLMPWLALYVFITARLACVLGLIASAERSMRRDLARCCWRPRSTDSRSGRSTAPASACTTSSSSRCCSC